MDEFDEIRAEWFEDYRKKAVVMIIAQPEGYFTVYQHSAGGVGPPTEYQTAKEAVARLAQLLDLKDPITPQNWPEHIQIGSVE